MRMAAALSLGLSMKILKPEEEEAMTLPLEGYALLFASSVSEDLVDHSLQNCQQQPVFKKKNKVDETRQNFKN